MTINIIYLKNIGNKLQIQHGHVVKVFFPNVIYNIINYIHFSFYQKLVSLSIEIERQMEKKPQEDQKQHSKN